MPNHPARVSYQWKVPGAKTHHGYAMGIVEASEQSTEAVVEALKKKYPKLEPFEIVILKLEWR